MDPQAARLVGYGTVSAALALLSDVRLGELVDSAGITQVGIGGTSTTLTIEGMPVFAAACAMVERSLRADIAAMNAAGLLHFDAHFRNILTDGRRLYLAPLPAFAPLARPRGLVTAVIGVPTPADGIPVERNAYVQRYAEGAEPVGVPPAIAEIIKRNAPVAAVMNDFYWGLFGESRTTPYPAEAVNQALTLVSRT